MYYDRDGRQWHQIIKKDPPYDIPKDALKLIWRETFKHLAIIKNSDSKPIDLMVYAVPLPFYSLPLCLSDKKYIGGVMDFLYCICIMCGQPIAGPSDLILLLIIRKTNHGDFYLNYRCALRGCCCAEIVNSNLTFYECILQLESQLYEIMKDTWIGFLQSINVKHKCYVCTMPLPNSSKQQNSKNPNLCSTECQRVMSLMSEYSGQTPGQIADYSLKDCFMGLFDYFERTNVNLFSCMLVPACYAENCNRQIQKNAKAFYCHNKCSRVKYCSRKCRNQDSKRHDCKLFTSIWTKNNYLFYEPECIHHDETGS